MKAVVAALALTSLATVARAEEGPTGHYVPGGVSDFIDAVPSKATIVVRFHTLRYEGNGGALAMPIAGLTVTNVRETRWAFGVTAAVRPNYTLTPRLGWAASITVPLVHVAVSGDVAQQGGGTIARGESITGIGDLFVAPLMLLYSLTPELSASGRVGLYMPTGRYQTGRISNTGKNYFTLQPLLGLEYFGEHNGIEAALHGGLDFNTMNKSTQYQTGIQAHVDATLAWHFQLGRGQVGVGGSGYWYRQIEADSGVGATLGSFEARSLGAGPVASYLFRVRKIAVAMDLRWTRDFGVRNRLDGDLWLFKAAAAP
jgi:hypothetical protein